jgi:hypothetical protein
MAKPVQPIRSKSMPKKADSWKRKSDKPESSAAVTSSKAASSADIPARKEHPKIKVKAPAARRETSRRAKEMFEDANAAREVYNNFKQEFTNIQWFQSLVEQALYQSAYFGASRHEQDQYRKDAYTEMITHLRRGIRTGNTYFQSFLKNGVEDFPFADFVYEPAASQRVPTLEEHYIEAQDKTSPLPIWRPSIMLDCPHYDLTQHRLPAIIYLSSTPAPPTPTDNHPSTTHKNITV